jgi:diguanylate cyclase (GGDEF)-like protein
MVNIDPDALFKAQQRLTSSETSQEEKEILRTLLLLIRQQASELDALKRISVNLTSTLNLGNVLMIVAREAIILVKNASSVHIFLFQNNKLKFGTSLDIYGKVNEKIADPRPEGLTVTVVQTGGTVIVEDMQNHPLYTGAPKSWTGSIIGIPLKMGTRVVGVMNLSRSKTGSFSREELRLLQLLADQAAIAIINADLHRAVSRQAYTDILTGLPNRRALDERLEQEVQRAKRYNRPFAVVMMDLDGFKGINDSYGHDVGDQVLQRTFGLLGRNVRTVDFLARYGGDELTLILPEANFETSLVVSQKLQSLLRRLVIEMPDGVRKTFDISGGIAIYPDHARIASDLLRAADAALYRSKRTARGTFVSATADEPPTRPRK